MNILKKYKVFLVIGIIVVIGFLVALDIWMHSVTYPLVDGDTIQRTGYSFVKEDGTRYRIDPSENIICINIDDQTYKVKNEELYQVLSLYQYVRLREKAGTYSTDDYAIEFTISEITGPKHFLLGESETIWYRSGGKAKFEVLDGKALVSGIYSLIEGAELLDY